MHERKILFETRYELRELDRGYANRALRVDVSARTVTEVPVDDQMKRLWTGGKGFDLWLTFREINKDTKWDSPENPICFSAGPLGGTTSFPGAGKTIVTAVSPMTQSMMDCNVGGYFGPFLKFAGFDAMMLTGISETECIIAIDSVEGTIRVYDATDDAVDSHILAEELTEQFARNEIEKRNIAVVSAGTAANFVRMGMLNFSFYDWRRGVCRYKQAARGGIGTVFRHKKIKALVLRSRSMTPAWRVEENLVAARITPRKLTRMECPTVREELDRIIDRWHSDPEYVIEMMQDIQERFRHIPKVALDQIQHRTRTPLAHLYHIATFYKSFSLEPRGETIVQVCMGTACHVKGAANILDSFERVLGIPTGGTTADGKYSLEAVACLGACSIAPVVRIGDEIVGNVESRHVEKLLKKHAAPSSTTPSGCADEEVDHE